MKLENPAQGDLKAPGAVELAQREAESRGLSSVIRRGLLSRLYPVLAETWQLLDACAVAGTFYVLARAHDLTLGERHVALIALSTGLMLLVYSWSDLFYRLRTRTLIEEAGRLLQGWVTVLVLLMAIGYLTESQSRFPRSVMLLWAGAAYLAQLAIHIGIRSFLHFLRRRGFNIRHALVVGCGEPLERIANFVASNPWLGIRIAGFVAEDNWLRAISGARRQQDGETASGGASKRAHAGWFSNSFPAQSTLSKAQLRHLGRLSDVDYLVERLVISEIYVTLPLERSSDAEAAMRTLVNIPVNVNWIPDFSLAQMLNTRTDTLSGQPLILLSDSRIDRHGQLVKRVEDLLLSALLIVLLFPLLAAIAWAVKRSSPGPILFRQRRHGLGGQPIVVWKFRTMRAESRTEIAKQATLDDQRVTPIGKWLRRWSLDELPQLFNVLEGSMSLVGPRPHPLWLNDQFSRTVDAYMQRHRVKPGLTGWAQVHGFRGETENNEKMERRVSYDLFYITHWSPLLDLEILLRTVPAVLLGKNAY
jgi:putative colanic acid biosynthesis UDP-glucose lipid carrier transferase